MKITLIVAQDKNGAIGKDGDMPWHLPNDLKWFKKNTLNKMIVMGRKTWDSLKFKPLPRRINIIMTTQSQFKPKGAMVCHSLNEVLTIALAKEEDELMIIGGGQIFELFYPLADEMIITDVDTEIDSPDAYFVNFSKNQWYECFEEPHADDEENPFAYTFKRYKRKIKSS